jgi:hypothetical protein
LQLQHSQQTPKPAAALAWASHLATILFAHYAQHALLLLTPRWGGVLHLMPLHPNVK